MPYPYLASDSGVPDWGRSVMGRRGRGLAPAAAAVPCALQDPASVSAAATPDVTNQVGGSGNRSTKCR